MTLQEFIANSKLLVSEFEDFRSKALLPKYHLSWTKEMWKNRWTGRTMLTDAEVFALGRILDEIRNPNEKTIDLN